MQTLREGLGIPPFFLGTEAKGTITAATLS